MGHDRNRNRGHRRIEAFMAVIDRLSFTRQSSGPEATWSGGGSIARRINWDNRTLRPGHGGNDASRPWDNMTPEKAREFPAWYRALIILSTAVGGMEINLNEVEMEDGGKKLNPGYDHPSFWPICVQANNEETAATARARQVWIAAQHGASYAGILRQVGKPIQIIPFAPYQCWPERINGEKWFLLDPNRDGPTMEPDTKRMRKLRPEDVIEIALPSNDGFFPDEPWNVGRMTLHEGHAGSRVRSARATNSGRPRLALTTDQALNDQSVARIREEFTALHTGLDDQVIPAILDRNLKPLPLAYSPEYQAESELYGISLRGIQNLTGVPATLLGDNDGRSYNAFESDIKMLYEFGLGPWLNSLEDQYKAKLLSPQERRRRETEICFDRQTTKFADTKTMAELIRALGAGAPIAKINEIRAKFGMSALDDPEAKKLLLPKNMGEDGVDNTPKDSKGASPGRPRLAAVSTGGIEATRLIGEKIVRRMSHEAARKASVVKAYMEYAGDLAENYTSLAESDFRALAGDGGIWVGKDVPAVAKSFIAECREQLLELAGQAKSGQLSAVVDKGLPGFCYRMPDRLIAILTGANSGSNAPITD